MDMFMEVLLEVEVDVTCRKVRPSRDVKVKACAFPEISRRA
jgi:hypothetical protein